jgi:hypothetical protein
LYHHSFTGAEVEAQRLVAVVQAAQALVARSPRDRAVHKRYVQTDMRIALWLSSVSSPPHQSKLCHFVAAPVRMLLSTTNLQANDETPNKSKKIDVLTA